MINMLRRINEIINIEVRELRISIGKTRAIKELSVLEGQLEALLSVKGKINDSEMSILDNDGVITIAKIIRDVETFFSMPSEQWLCRGGDGSRLRKFVVIRQLAMYLAYRCTRLSLADIGEGVGGYDHATVLHAKKQYSNVPELIKIYNDFMFTFQYKIDNKKKTNE